MLGGGKQFCIVATSGHMAHISRPAIDNFSYNVFFEYLKMKIHHVRVQYCTYSLQSSVFSILLTISVPN